MRFTYLITLVFFVLLAIVPPVSLAAAAVSPEEASKHLPDKLGDFKAVSSARAFEDQSADTIGSFDVISAAIRSYQSRKGETVSVALVVTRSASSAYALLTNSGCPGGQSEENGLLAELGTKRCVFANKVLFARGPIFVAVEFKKGESVTPEALKSLASVLAPNLDKGDDDVPVLVKHLPDWQNTQRRISYAANKNTLENVLRNQPVLDAVNFEGGAEAAVAHYDAGTLAIIEFNTPQIATTNDHDIAAKLKELRATVPPVGTSLPPAYRRVGNYAVFVFDAPNEQAANQLIDQVKYQQVVQWLGENPFAYEQATREFTETTLGVFVSVVKTSGLALVACLAAGGFFGALLFRFRRSQQRAREAYSDSDAMIRLNLDDLTPESDPARLLGRGN
jgi:hypothetical protein